MQSKGNNSSITDDTLIQYQEIPFIGYVDMAENRKKHRHLGNERAVTPL